MSHVLFDEYQRNTYRVKARHLHGTTAETAAVCDWLVELGYPWLRGDALVPERLEPAKSKGIWIDPTDGFLFIRTSEEEFPNRFYDIKVRYGEWILIHPGGGVRTMDSYNFDRKFSSDENSKRND